MILWMFLININKLEVTVLEGNKEKKAWKTVKIWTNLRQFTWILERKHQVAMRHEIGADTSAHFLNEINRVIISRQCSLQSKTCVKSHEWFFVFENWWSMRFGYWGFSWYWKSLVFVPPCINVIEILTYENTVPDQNCPWKDHARQNWLRKDFWLALARGIV